MGSRFGVFVHTKDFYARDIRLYLLCVYGLQLLPPLYYTHLHTIDTHTNNGTPSPPLISSQTVTTPPKTLRILRNHVRLLLQHPPHRPSHHHHLRWRFRRRRPQPSLRAQPESKTRPRTRFAHERRTGKRAKSVEK